MTIQEIIKQINADRKSHKNNWYSGVIMHGKSHMVRYKGYGTWLQVVEIHSANGNIVNESVTAKTVKDFNAKLQALLEQCLK